MGSVEQFFLAETKKKTFERVRGEAEKVAREFEGGKVVEQSMRDLYRDLCADLERLQEATESKRVLHSSFTPFWAHRLLMSLGNMSLFVPSRLVVCQACQASLKGTL